jgi:hypothetical protein
LEPFDVDFNASNGCENQSGAQVSEYVAFISALRAGRQMRARMYDTIEQRHAHDFASGKDGERFYENLLSAVRDSGATEAVEEFESRFFPLVNPRQARPGAKTGPSDGVSENRRRGGWGLAASLCAAVIALGVALIGFNALRMRTAERATIAASPIPAAHATTPASQSDTMNEPLPRPAAEGPAAEGPTAEAALPADATELVAPEIITNPAPSPAAGQEVSPER